MRNLLIISIAVLTLSGCASTQFGQDGTRTSATIQTVDGVTPEVTTISNTNEIIVKYNAILCEILVKQSEILVKYWSSTMKYL